MRKLTTTTLILSFLAATGLFAQQKPMRDPKTVFARLDKDGDGRLTPVEFQAKAKNPDKRAARFRKLDVNADGFLTFDEFAAGFAKKN